jgi:glycosyltransferase involved in cell wall biosynthesis
VVFNAQDCIADCLESVLYQDYPNMEHIIFDGGSTDSTVSLLRKYVDRIDVWISESDSGIYDAWNKGLKLARGEWIAFLGADDKYLPGAVSAYMKLAAQFPAAEFLSSRALLDHPSGHAPTFGGPWEWPRFSRVMTTNSCRYDAEANAL